jgi:hypothetical protein
VQCYGRSTAGLVDTLERTVAEKTQDLSALYALTSPMSRASQMQDVLTDAVAKIIEVTGADAALIRFLDEASGQFTYSVVFQLNFWTFR